MNVWFVLLVMIWLHIFDDYFLQGQLCQLKQKQWWIDKGYIDIYKYDYIVALICHSFSWSFSIMFPVALWLQFNINYVFVIIFIVNIIIHAVVDDLKCNKLLINLIIDQVIHFIQIVCTFLFLLDGFI